jgi:hypothetical protein
MGYSKRQFIEAAFDEIGLAAYTFDMQPEQYQSALRRLDALMADWNERGIRLGYPLPGSPQASNLDEQTSVPDRANEAIITNLACRIAPSYGKQVLPATMTTAHFALNTIMVRAATPTPMQLPGTMPAGAGNKPWTYQGDPFLPEPVSPLLAGQDGPIEFE